MISIIHQLFQSSEPRMKNYGKSRIFAWLLTSFLKFYRIELNANHERGVRYFLSDCIDDLKHNAASVFQVSPILIGAKIGRLAYKLRKQIAMSAMNLLY
jgi:hypothetical protein